MKEAQRKHQVELPLAFSTEGVDIQLLERDPVAVPVVPPSCRRHIAIAAIDSQVADLRKVLQDVGRAASDIEDGIAALHFAVPFHQPRPSASNRKTVLEDRVNRWNGKQPPEYRFTIRGVKTRGTHGDDHNALFGRICAMVRQRWRTPAPSARRSQTQDAARASEANRNMHPKVRLPARVAIPTTNGWSGSGRCSAARVRDAERSCRR